MLAQLVFRASGDGEVSRLLGSSGARWQQMSRRDEVEMVPEFAWLPPEVNSARIFAGAGGVGLAAGWAGGGVGDDGYGGVAGVAGCGSMPKGMPGEMMGRGGANPHVVQARPSVIARTGIG
ncbi:hypothetical protein A4G27_25175 [Mycobacterium kansasii]|nr:hypothetical protein A4G27_25175 [Mycobacterium kansasii]